MAQGAITKPTRLDWIVSIFVVLIQQGSFVWLPHVMADPTDMSSSVDSPLNTVCIIISFIMIIYVISRHWRKVIFLVVNNPFVVVFTLITFLSTIWSLHPDLSSRRALGYFLTMLIAAFIL